MDPLSQDVPSQPDTTVDTQTTTPPPIRGETRIEDIWGHFPQVTAIPTYTPKTFNQSIAVDTTTGALYYYDYTNNEWRTVSSAPTGVTTFNTRTGAVTLTNADVLAASDTIQTYTPTGGGTATLDLSKGNVHYITMPAGNITIAISNATVGQTFCIRILQDSSGSRTVTWFTTIKWAGGTAPTLTTTANKADTLVFQVTGSNTYDGGVALADL